MAKIVLTLCSDLCPANGGAFNSGIDIDVCCDALGIPYIPSRRLKGCLREAAEDIGCDKIDEIFGKPGAAAGGSLRFSSDARISDYDAAGEELRAFEPEKVLELFTYVRAGTAIENGAAKPGSLRFTRVVKQYSPADGQPLQFVAECEIDSRYTEAMADICKALRNIGYRRNRGFGAVRCRFAPGEDGKKQYFPMMETGKRYTLPITITNTVPLVLSGRNDDETETYIGGGQILGALAWAHPDKDSDDFANLFLRGGIVFSNCVPGTMPAPLCYAKMKRAGIYINRAKDKIPENDTPKPLKNKYLDENNQVIEAKQEVVCHHRVQTKERAALLYTPSPAIITSDLQSFCRHASLSSPCVALVRDGSSASHDGKNPRKSDVIIAGERVYTQTALCAGQVFTGTISGNGEYLRQLEPLLAGRMLRIGKSKTAQYAACKIVVGKAEEISLRPPEIIVPGKETAVILLADALLLKNGVYTTDRDVLLEAIGLGAEIREEKTSLEYRTIAGYSGVWNLKKPHARAFKAGSVLVYKSIDAAVPKEFSIGERRHEGFGLCKVMTLEDMPEVKAATQDNFPDKKQGCYSALMQLNADNEKIRADAIAYARQNRLDDAVTPSQIGRVLLMLKQSNGDWKNLQSRIASIKAEAVKNTLQSYMGSEISKDTEFWETVLRWQKYRRKAESAAKGLSTE